MFDILDFIHYMIGITILSFFIWVIIKLHLYFSKNNESIEKIMDTKFF